MGRPETPSLNAESIEPRIQAEDLLARAEQAIVNAEKALSRWAQFRDQYSEAR